MKNIRLILFLVFAAVSIGAPLSIIWKHESALRYGKEYKFRTKPVDPYDAFRGRYVTLGFEDDTLKDANANDKEDIERGRIYYVRLGVDAKGFAVPLAISAKPLSGDDVITVDSAYRYSGEWRIDYPFDRYYLPEDIAPLAEQLYRSSNAWNADEEAKKNSYVTIRVRNSVGVLDQLYLNGKSVREAIKEELAKKPDSKH